MEFYDIKLDPSTNKIVIGKNYSSFEPLRLGSIYLLVTTLKRVGKILLTCLKEKDYIRWC